MPEERRTSCAGISSSVAVFLLLTSICCMLSLSSNDDREEEDDERDARQHHDDAQSRVNIRIRKYIPNFVMMTVLLIGIAAMLVFVFKRQYLTCTRDHEATRLALHSKYSLWGITMFFVGVCLLGINYILVEISCADKWTHCDDKEIILDNSSQVALLIVWMLFASCETMICWTFKSLNFMPSQWVWHCMAVVQAANIAVWFDSVLKESDHLNKENVRKFDSYISLCNVLSMNTTGNNSETDEWCSKKSIAPKWFAISTPFLFPILIEFSLLVSKTLLHKIIGTQSHGSNAEEGSDDHEMNVHGDASTEDHNERMPLLPSQNEKSRMPNSANSICSNIFIMISVVINTVFSLLTILVFLGYNWRRFNDELQTYENILTVYRVAYDLFAITCCAVGIQCCRRFRRQHSHTSFLEYLLLFATSGVLLHSTKRIVAFAVNSTTSRWISTYYIVEVLDMTQALVQIVFYYYAKDVKLRLTNDGGRADSPLRVAVLKNIMVVISINNFARWIGDSFLLPEMSTSVTPSDYSIERWPVFDNVVTPIAIFFHFNSALLFCCIGTDVF